MSATDVILVHIVFLGESLHITWADFGTNLTSKASKKNQLVKSIACRTFGGPKSFVKALVNINGLPFGKGP